MFLLTRIQEAKSKNVNLPKDSPATIARVLSFLYTGDYDDSSDIILDDDNSVDSPLSPAGSIAIDEMSTGTQSSKGDEDIPGNSLSVYLAANRFQINPLKQLAKKKYISWARRNMTNKRLPDVLREAIDVSPLSDHEMHDAIAEFIAENAMVLMKNEKIVTILEDFKACCIGFSVLKRLVKIQASDRAKIKDLQDEIASRDTLWDELVSRSCGTPYCRRCSRQFNSRIDGGTIFENAVVCKLCNTVS